MQHLEHALKVVGDGARRHRQRRATSSPLTPSPKGMAEFKRGADARHAAGLSAPEEDRPTYVEGLNTPHRLLSHRRPAAAARLSGRRDRGGSGRQLCAGIRRDLGHLSALRENTLQSVTAAAPSTMRRVCRMRSGSRDPAPEAAETVPEHRVQRRPRGTSGAGAVARRGGPRKARRAAAALGLRRSAHQLRVQFIAHGRAP